MSDLFGNHIVGFPTRWIIYCFYILDCLGAFPGKESTSASLLVHYGIRKNNRIIEIIAVNHLSRDARKPVFGSSEQVQHKSACTVTEDG